MKKPYIILICAMVVALVVWLVERPDKFDVGDFKSFKLCEGLAGKDIGKIEVEQMVSGSVLTQSGDEWNVSDFQTKMGEELNKEEAEPADLSEFRADAQKITAVIEKLGGLEATALISNNKEKQTLYQVGDLAKKVRVFDTSGKVLASLYIGKNGPDMFSTYVRRDGEDNVYMVVEHIGGMIPADVMSWRDKKIWEIDPANIKAINVTKKVGKKEPYAISKVDDGTWQLTEPSQTTLDSAKVQEFLGKVSRLFASRFAHSIDKEMTGLDNPSVKLGITTTDGQLRTLLVGGGDKQGYLYARMEGKDYEVYLLDSNFGSRIPDSSSWFMTTPTNKTK